MTTEDREGGAIRQGKPLRIFVVLRVGKETLVVECGAVVADPLLRGKVLLMRPRLLDGTHMEMFGLVLNIHQWSVDQKDIMNVVNATVEEPSGSE